MTPAPSYAGVTLCPADAIPEGGAREVWVGPRDDPLHVVLFRTEAGIFAYRNQCPHFMLPLNAGPGRFILLKDGLVMCAWHSAVFRIADGAGIDGPCMGSGLEPLPLVERDGQLILGGAAPGA